MADGSIDRLSISIGASSSKAVSQINNLATALQKLRVAVSTIDSGSASKIQGLATALQGLKGIGTIKLSDKLPAQLKSIADTANSVSDDAISKIERLSSALGGLKGLSLGSVSSIMNATQKPENPLAPAETGSSAVGGKSGSEQIDTTAESADRASSLLKKLKSFADSASAGLRNLGKSAEKSTSGLGTMFAALKRIAMYRLFRTIIKSISTAFKEGLQNAYAFSQGILSEGARFATAMDSMSSAGLKMKNQLGSAFIGLLAAITPIVNAIIALVTKLATALSQLFAMFTGGTYLKANDVTKKFADNMERGGGAAKEWKNQLMGFDEINRLEDPGSGGGGGGAAALNPEDMFEDTAIDGIFAKLKAKMDELKASLNFDNLKESWERLKESAKSLGDTIEKALGWVWENILVPLAHWTIEETAPAAINLLASAFEFLNAVLNALNPVFQWLWDNILKPLAEWTGEMFIHALETMTGLFEKLTSLLEGNSSFKDFIDDLTPAEAIFLSIATAITAVTTALTLYNAVTGIAAVVTGLTVSPILLVIAAFAALIAIVIAVAQHWDEIKEKFKEGAEELREDWQRTKDTFSEIFEKIKDIATQLWESIVQTVSDIKDKFKEAGDELRGDWDRTKEFFVSIWTTITEKVSGAVDKVMSKIQKFRDDFRTKMDAIGDKASEIKQKIIDFFSFEWRLPHISLPHLQVQWEPAGDLARFFGISAIPNISIAWYAQGGFPEDGLFMANHGELVGKFANGKTAVANNEQITEGIASAVYDAFMAAFSQTSGNGGDDRPVNIYLDGREIARTTTKYQNQMARAGAY